MAYRKQEENQELLVLTSFIKQIKKRNYFMYKIQTYVVFVQWDKIIFNLFEITLVEWDRYKKKQPITIRDHL